MFRARLPGLLTLGTLLLGAATLALLAEPVSSKSGPANRTGLRLEPVGQFKAATFITSPPQDASRLFVVERAGTIRVVRGGKLLKTAFLDIHNLVGTNLERGLLSMAFKPDYEQSGLFYIYYTALDGVLTIVEYRRSATDPDRADPATRRRVMVIAHPSATHNSGQLQFGPDGYLYAGTGDGGGVGDPEGDAQDPRSPLGKILRFDPTGTADLQRSSPPDNPFLGRPEVPPEMWATGLRNPWRFSFDKVTGDLAIADVGEGSFEEIDFVRKGLGGGKNFGWNHCEGLHAYPPHGKPRAKCDLQGTVPPVIEHSHAAGFCSVIGGVVVRDRSLVGLYGHYIYGDLCRPELRSAALDKPGRGRRLGLELEGVITFGQSANGCVYVGTFTNVYRIAAAATTAPCPPGGPGPVAHPPPDRRRPAVLVRTAPRLRALSTGVIRIHARCDEPCRIEASAMLARVKGRPLTRVFARTKRAPGGQLAGLTIRLRGARGLFAGRSRGFANLRVRVFDQARNVRTIRRPLRLVR